MRAPGDVLQATYDSFHDKLAARDAVEQNAGTGRFILPRRVSMSTGQVAYDCEQLSVVALDLYQGQPGSRTSGYQPSGMVVAPYALDLAVTLVRDVPSIDNAARPPSVEALNTSALQTAKDAQVLTDTFWAAMNDDSIAGTCDFVHFGGVTWAGPQGGLLGTVLSLAVQL